MNQTMECGEARISLGVYVLGAIDPAERAMVDAHLATCRDCRDELAGLAGLPALLARVNPEDALLLGEEDLELPEPATEPPRELLGTVLDLTAARRRRRGWRNGLLAAAAAAVIAAGAFGGTHFLIGNSAPSSTAAQGGDDSNFGNGGSWDTAQVTSSGGQGATIRYRQMGWGLQIDTKVVGIPIGTKCDLYVITKSGQRVQAGGWVTDIAEGTVWYSGSASVMDAQVASFEVTTGGRTPPVKIPAGSDS